MTARATRLALLAVATTLVGLGAPRLQDRDSRFHEEARARPGRAADRCAREEGGAQAGHRHLRRRLLLVHGVPVRQAAGRRLGESGYTGGTKANPSYEEVSSGSTGHAESVDVVYDPSKVTYSQLLDAYWHNIDPLTANGQICDFGTQYRTVIFFHDPEQKRLAEESKRQLEASGRFKQPIVTQIVPASTSTRPRTTIRTTPRRTRCAIACTASAAAAMRA